MFLLQKQHDKNYLVKKKKDRREKSSTSSVDSNLHKSQTLHCWVRRQEETEQLCGQFALLKKQKKKG